MRLAKHSKIYVAGHRGLAGSAICRALQRHGFDNLLVRTHAELDLTRQAEVESFLAQEKPDAVIIAAAKVGGIYANMTFPAQFIQQNLAIALNLIHAAFANDIQRLIFLGSSCIYPRDCPQPMREEHLLTGSLEPTNRPYAVAKIAGIELCWAYNRQYGTHYVALQPTNLYGPGDNYHPTNSHVIPGLLRRFHEAKIQGQTEVRVWGSGRPLREFLHADDLGEACLTVLNLSDEELAPITRSSDLPPLLNVGSGEEISVAELAQLIAEVVGYNGKIQFDPSMPDGTMRKLLDSSRMHRLGWRAQIRLCDGLCGVYEEMLASPTFLNGAEK